MEPSNAWDRAQEAIVRAQQRNATVVTPDSAESPFDASATQMIPQSALRPSDEVTTQRHYRPSPGELGHRDGRHRQPPGWAPREPETTPVEVSDPTLMRPVPAEAPTVRTAATRPPTAPFPAQDRGREDQPRPDDSPTTPPVGVKVPFWKRLFRR
ncbi:hypothetical protein [Actinomycetospora soli]|uniref:hypothetical protein n=1 Tax=Actinomycetospora soli TaxID=2893887 RepID=UPI001E5B3A63|nr:hypothetical protein [Actinomycetospora soli]MCD2189115.1 hypothetical protein [Actinomycetospora soli]